MIFIKFIVFPQKIQNLGTIMKHHQSKYHQVNCHLFLMILYPGRTCTVVNGRLRWNTETYGGRTQDPYTGTVYGVKRWETDTVYGDRIKIWSDLMVTVCTSYTIVYYRVRPYTVTVCVTFQIHTEVSEYINSKYF